VTLVWLIASALAVALIAGFVVHEVFVRDHGLRSIAKLRADGQADVYARASRGVRDERAAAAALRDFPAHVEQVGVPRRVPGVRP
jgi:hypothetical protein